VLLAVAGALWALSGIRALVSGIQERLRREQRASWISFAIVAVLCGAYLMIAAAVQHRDLTPLSHDEQSYLLQMQMLARGRLWMPPHPLADFFDTFMVLNRPVYASIYFPGTALLFVPAIWLHAPTWVLPLICTSAAGGLLYVILTQILDREAGILGVLMLLACSQVRQMGLELRSHAAMLLLGLLMILLFLRWRKNPTWHWALGFGIIAGWAAITRPIDALCFAAPLVASAAMVRAPFRNRMIAVAAACLGIAPFLLLQLIFNLGVTGRAFQTPFGLYIDRDQPRASLGFHFAAQDVELATRVQQKILYYRYYALPRIQKNQPENLLHVWFAERLPILLNAALPHALLIVLMTIGIGAGLLMRPWREPTEAILASGLLLWLAYALYPFFLVHYAVVWMPSMILATLLGARAVENLWPRQRWIGGALGIFIAGTSLASMPPLSAAKPDPWHAPLLADANEKLAHLDHVPAVVLFRYVYPSNPHEEPVYNSDVVWPDDAPVIRAHDLGPARDREIFEYYANRQPQRFFYLYDRGERTLRPLGWARDLARAATQPTTVPR
jgi:hypothetical protein